MFKCCVCVDFNRYCSNLGALSEQSFKIFNITLFDDILACRLLQLKRLMIYFINDKSFVVGVNVNCYYYYYYYYYY